jgi:ankyrin repeat protein
MRRLQLTLIIGALFIAALVAAAPSDSAVADASMKGNKEAVRALLKQGADVNAALPDGMTALHWAAVRGDAELAEMLLYAGASTKAVTRIGAYTPLHVASREGNANVAKLLLEKGAEVDARTSTSSVTALHLAAASGNLELTKILIDNKADVNAREGEWGQTPLIFAAAQNCVDVIKLLLQRGANPGIASKVVDIAKETNLINASNALEKKVLESYRTSPADLPTPSQVQAAVMAGREVYLSGVVPKGLENTGRGSRGGGGGNGGNALNEEGRGPTINTKGGLTALLHAARQGNIGAALALVDGGAKIDQVSPGDGTSPLLMAIINAQFDLAMDLIKRGANPNLSAFNGVAPLWATLNSEWQPRTRYPQPQEHGLQKATYMDVMQALLDAGADPNARVTKHPWYMVYTGCGNANCGLEDTEGSSPFWRAAYATDVDAMRLLVQRGANPNIPTIAPAGNGNRSGTPLDKIDTADGIRPVQPVAPGLWPATDATSIGPDPSGLPPVPPGGPGVYPIHAATGVGYGEGFAGNAHHHAPDAWLAALKFLVEELGVDVNQRDYNGYTAMHHAAARGDNEMVLYLVSKGGDVKAVARTGQTTADMANGPVQRVSPIPETVALLEKLGSKNNHKCVSC